MILEYTLNKILRLAPNEYQQQLAGKNVEIYCTDFNKKLYILFSLDYVHLSLQAPTQIDTTISGPLNGFIHLILNKQQADLRAHDMKIYGDLFCAESLQKLMANLDIDWEEELSKYTNDAIAHQICLRLNQLRNYQQRSSDSLAGMITEYLQEEARILPTKSEVDEFMQEVDQLRLAVDRLAARIEAYENN